MNILKRRKQKIGRERNRTKREYEKRKKAYLSSVKIQEIYLYIEIPRIHFF
jgi:hypothetical protein